MNSMNTGLAYTNAQSAFLQFSKYTDFSWIVKVKQRVILFSEEIIGSLSFLTP